MSNYEIIGQALAILRELLADYILQQLQTVPEYKVMMPGGSKACSKPFTMSVTSTDLQR